MTSSSAAFMREDVQRGAPRAKPTNFEIGTVRTGEDGARWRVVQTLTTRDGNKPHAHWEPVDKPAFVRSPPPPVRSSAPREPAPKLAFAAGDDVEAVYTEGCWAPARVLDAKGRQVHVEYEVEDDQASRAAAVARPLLARESDTPREIARRLGLPVGLLLQINKNAYAELTASSKLRGGTVLSMPEVAAARENDTLGKLAKELGRPVQAFVDLNAESIEGVTATTKLKKNSLVLVPPPAAPAEGEPPAAEKPAPARPSGSPWLGETLLVEVERDDAKLWVPSEVRRLLVGGKFEVCIDGDEEFIEAYGMADEHKEWRHKDGRQAAAARGPRGELPSVGDEIQAEVNDDDGRTRWRDAEVRRLLEGGRFECCIDGDEDFNEEYGMADEGTEWRLKPPADASVPRAHEWVKQEFVRPPVPRAPDGYLDAATAGTTLQLWFDSAWWRATLLGRDQPSEADLAVAEAEAIARATAPAAADAAAGGEGGGEGGGEEGAAAAAAAPPPLTFSVQLLERGEGVPLRVRRKRVRPDWKWSDGAWKLPPNARARSPPPLAAVAAPVGGGAPSPGRAAGERLAASSAPGKPPPTHAWACAGACAEVQMREPVFRNAWWAATLLELQPEKVLVQIDAFADTEYSAERLQAWIPSWSRVRPAPPPPPRDWLAATRPTEVVELWVEDAWWEASLVLVKADVAVVRRNTEPPQTLSVGHERLRPGWRWDSAAGWTAPCIAAAIDEPAAMEP